MWPSRAINLIIFAAFLLLSSACEHSDPANTVTVAQIPTEISNPDNQSDPVIETTPEPETGTAIPDVTFATTMAMPDFLGDTLLISVDSNEQQSNANSINGSISADGRYVVFDSIASNLVTDDNNETWDIFLRDRLNETTIRVSQSSQGTDSDGASIDPVISDDGTVVVFSSSATNLVDDDTNQVADIFRMDLITGSLVRISVNRDLEEANNDNDAPDVSADGRFIVYESNATNLSADNDSNGATDIYLYDSQTGLTERVSVNSAEEQGNGISRNPSVSDNGRFIVFESHSTNLVADDANDASDIFMRDRELGITFRLSLSNGGEQANNDSATPMINANGTVVVFQSTASNLVDDDDNDVRDIFVRDLVTSTTSRVSIRSNGNEANASNYASPAIDASGRYVVFYSSANNLVENDNNNSWDVFVHDRESRQTALVSVNSNGQQGNASSFIPALSAGGHYVVFGSGAVNLVDDDSNESWDIFTHVLIQPNRAPIADAGNDVQIFLGESVTLNGAGSSDPDLPAPQLTYLWNIEAAPQGSSATIVGAVSETATLVPDMLGEYVVSLVVNDGETDSVPDEILVSVVENLAPEAVVNASLVSGTAPLTVVFNGDDSRDPEGAQLLYHWNFNDPDSLQNSSGEVSDTHIFNQPGQYTVLLTVTDDFGHTDQASVVINVEAPQAPNMPPTVQPVASPNSGTAPLTVNFTANAVDEDGDALTYIWDFADGSMASDVNPIHQFQQQGVYDVSVTVSDGEHDVQGTVRVTVGASFNLISQFIKLETRRKKQAKDKIQIKAAFDKLSNSLMTEDVVRISINQVVILEQPLGEFVPGDKAGLWIYRDRHIHVKLDLAAGYIKVFKNKTDLSDIDTSLPVNIELAFGNTIASEQVQLREIGHRRCNEKDHLDQRKEKHRHCDKGKTAKYIYKATGGYSDRHEHKEKDHDDEYHDGKHGE
ncbi:PKD domain-containing protein [Kaarinaea lacus]